MKLKKILVAFIIAALCLTPMTVMASDVVTDVLITSNAKCGVTIADPTVAPTGCSIADVTTDVFIASDDNPTVNLRGNVFNLYEVGKFYTMKVTLTPDTGKSFSLEQTKVKIDGQEIEPSSLILEADGKLTVTYNYEMLYTVSVFSNGGGSATADPTRANKGEIVKITPVVLDQELWALDKITGKYAVYGVLNESDFDAEHRFTMPEGNTEITVDFKRIAYGVSFVMNGHGSAIDRQVVEPNAKAEYVEPSSAGYIFGGWFTDAECTAGNEFNFNTLINNDYTLFAKWTEDAGLINYPVWIGGNRLNNKYPTDANGDVDVFGDGSVIYKLKNGDKEAQLYLKDAVIDSSVLLGDLSNAIIALENLTVNISGDNRLGAIVSDVSKNSGFSVFCGIKAGNFAGDPKFYDITLAGDGNLTIYDQLQGIHANTISIGINGTLKIREYGAADLACCLKAEDKTVVLNRGTVDLESCVSNGVYGELTVKGGSLEAFSHNHNEQTDLYALNSKPVIPSDYVIKGGEDKNSAIAITTDKATTMKYVKISKAEEPNPKTADNSKVWLWCFMGVFSLAVIASLTLLKKRDR